MGFLSWNCQGLAYFNGLVWYCSLNLIFLIETICLSNSINEIKDLLGYACCIYVDHWGGSAGLTFLWKKAGSIDLLGQGDHYIDVVVRLEGEEPCRLTGYNGYTDKSISHQSWNLLRELSTCSNLA